MVFGWSKTSSSSYTTSTAAAASSAAAVACSELRAAYHECFNRWYAEKFAKGQWHKDDCAGEWHMYCACLGELLEDKHLRQILLESETSSYSLSLMLILHQDKVRPLQNDSLGLTTWPSLTLLDQNSEILGRLNQKVCIWTHVISLDHVAVQHLRLKL